MNTEFPSDQILKDIFRNVPQPAPGPHFTLQVMNRLNPGLQMATVPAGPSIHFGFRVALALGISFVFFGVLVFTSDFGFMDYFYNLAGSLLKTAQNASWMEVLSQSVQKIQAINTSHVVMLSVCLAGALIFIIDLMMGRKSRMSGLGFFLG